MFLTYDDSNVASFLLELLEDTCDETLQWTGHNDADSIPYEVRHAIDPRFPVVEWFDCSMEHRTFVLVVACAEHDTHTYTLYGVDGSHQVTRLRRATEYPGSTDLLFILAQQVFEYAKIEQHEAVEQFLGGIMRDRLADLEDSDE